MKFSIGDPVYVKSNQEEGSIEEFIGKDMASVKVGKGSYFVYLDDLEHPYLRWFTKNNGQQKSTKLNIDQLKPEEKSARKQQIHDGFFLIVYPIYDLQDFDDKVIKLKFFVHNETDQEYKVQYSVKIKNNLIFDLDFDVNDHNEFYIHDLTFEEAASNPLFLFHVVDKKNSACDNEFQIQMKPKRLFEFIDKIRYENKPFFQIPIFEELLPRAKKEVVISEKPLQNIENKRKTHFNFNNTKNQNPLEIDLHIEQLVIKHAHLSPSEMLHIQLTECQKALDLAYATHQKCIILIHGVGKGKLKNEIHLLLNQTNWIDRYVFEYDVRFGYGATKVFLKS